MACRACGAIRVWRINDAPSRYRTLEPKRGEHTHRWVALVPPGGPAQSELSWIMVGPCQFQDGTRGRVYYW